MIRFWKRAFPAASSSSRSLRGNVGRNWEALEDRRLLTSPAGSDYILSGFAWSNPSKVTYSYPADGMNWDFGTNDINAKLGASFSGDGWKREFAKAIQTWAASANINVVPVADSNARFNAAGLSQGDPNFGDIRIGGYDFGNQTTLAQTYYPPPNSATAGGDVEVNTSFDFKPGGPYDFFSVMLHETGHSFGLADLSHAGPVMATVYGGVRPGLTPDDVGGIQAQYGARLPDSYLAAGQGTSFTNSVDVSSRLNGSNQGSLGGVWLTTIGETDYYSIVAPAYNGSSLQVTAAASGISSLSPKITIFDTSQNSLGTQSDATRWSDDMTVTVPNAVAGHRYVVAVTGATNDVFSVGAYQLRFGFNGGTAVNPTPTPPPVNSPPPGGGVTPTPPVIAPPVTPPPITVPPFTPRPAPMPPTIPPDIYDLNNDLAHAANLGTIGQTVLTGLSLDKSGQLDVFTFRAARSGTVTLLNTSAYTMIVNEQGQVVASGSGTISFKATRAGSRFIVIVKSTDGAPVANYALGIVIQPAAPPNRVVARKRAFRHH